MNKAAKLCILFFLLFFADLNVNGQNLKFKFINKTGKNVDSLNVNGVLVGHIDKDSTSQFIFYSSMTFDSGYPIVSMRAYIDNKKVSTRKFIDRCGTEMKEIKTGEYLYYLKYYITPVDTFINISKLP